MTLVGRVIAFSIEKNKDSDTPVLMLQVELTEGQDIQSIELVRHAGVDHNPPPGSFVVAVPVTESLRLAVASDDGVLPESLPGDYEIYSSLGRVKQAKVKCEAAGNLSLNSSPTGNITIDSGAVGSTTIDGGTQGAARQNDAIQLDLLSDPEFFAWIAAVSAFCSVSPIPESIAGRISEGSSKVKIG